MLTWRPPCPRSRHPGSATGLCRLTGKAAAYQLREATSTHLRPFQWGVNTSRGFATIARDYLRRQPDHVLLKMDIANTFNNQSRGAFLTAVTTSFPELLPLAAQFYQLPTTLYIRGKETTLDARQHQQRSAGVRGCRRMFIQVLSGATGAFFRAQRFSVAVAGEVADVAGGAVLRVRSVPPPARLPPLRPLAVCR